MIRIGNVLKVIAGQAAPKKFNEIGYPFIRAGHLKDLINGLSLKSLPKVANEVAKSKRLKLIPSGTILFAKSGMSATKNRVYITNEESYIVSHLAGILPSKEINSSFLAKYLTWYNISKLILDDAYPSIRLQDINNLKIPLPPLPTQKKIAAILDEADRLRNLNKKLIEKYDELSQSLFLEMFGDPVSNPMGWEKVPLKNCTSKIGSGSTPRGGKEAYKKEGISLIRSLNVYDTEFRYKNLAFIDDDQALRLKNVTVEKNDVLFNITGASVCRCTIVPDNVIPARVNQHVAILRPSKGLLNSVYLNYTLISKNCKAELIGVGTQGGATREAITKDELEKFKIPAPSIFLQNQFAERIKAIEEQKTQAQVALQKSEDLFNSLLQKAFKGELVQI